MRAVTGLVVAAFTDDGASGSWGRRVVRSSLTPFGLPKLFTARQIATDNW
jgi:hypothetical protein